MKVPKSYHRRRRRPQLRGAWKQVPTNTHNSGVSTYPDSVTLYASECVKLTTAVVQPRDENSTPYEAEPEPYTGPIGLWRKLLSRSVDDPHLV